MIYVLVAALIAGQWWLQRWAFRTGWLKCEVCRGVLPNVWITICPQCLSCSR